jgi:hypothetical protein
MKALFLIGMCSFFVAFANPNKRSVPLKDRESWIIEGTGESPDLKQLPELVFPELPLPSARDYSGSDPRSPLRLLLLEMSDPDAGTALPKESWNLSVDGLLPPPMSQP